MSVYGRMERMARGEVGQPRLFRQRILEVFFVVASVFLLGYLLYAAQFSGTVRWFLGFAVIVAVSVYAWWAVAVRTAEPVPMRARSEPARTKAGELSLLTAMVHRANQGLPYSQAAVSSRARDAFEERARRARGLSLEAMRGLRGDPAGLRAAFRDPALEAFLFLSSMDSDERYRWVRAVREGEGFETGFRRVLDRMEAWR